MKEMYLYVCKNARVLTFLALMVFVFSSCSQRIAGNYKTNRMEIEQVATITPEGKVDKQVVTEELKLNEPVATAENIKKEVNENTNPVKARNVKKELKRIIKEESKKAKNEDANYAASKKVISALPLLAMKSNTKSVKAPMRDFLVLGIVLLVIGLVLGIFGGIFGVIGAILAVIGLVLIILYIVDVMV